MEMEQSRFVCKLCSKRFPCGKSFGGHMRSHVVASNSGEPQDELAEYAYGLRENPKKTWRAADSRSPPLSAATHGRICKRCGKGFQSLKALCGHMACHSEKDKAVKDDTSWSSEKVGVEGFSDTEEDDRRKLRVRSRNQQTFSAVSEIDLQEQEEVARCLMLLSRDNWGAYSVVESSDNNSVVLETKSSSIEMKMKRIGLQKLKDQMEDSDSVYFLDEPETESDEESRAEVIMKYEERKGFQNPVKKTEEEDVENEKSTKRSKYECFNCKKIFKSYQALGGHRPCSRRSTEQPGDDQSYCHSSHRKQSHSKKGSVKKSKSHACPFCDRVFKNGQALGGHKRSHFLTSNGEGRNRAPLQKRGQLDLNLPAPVEDVAFSW